MKQPEIKLSQYKDESAHYMEIYSSFLKSIRIGKGKTEETMLRAVVRNLNKLLADAEKKLKEAEG